MDEKWADVSSPKRPKQEDTQRGVEEKKGAGESLCMMQSDVKPRGTPCDALQDDPTLPVATAPELSHDPFRDLSEKCVSTNQGSLSLSARRGAAGVETLWMSARRRAISSHIVDTRSS